MCLSYFEDCLYIAGLESARLVQTDCDHLIEEELRKISWMKRKFVIS